MCQSMYTTPQYFTWMAKSAVLLFLLFSPQFSKRLVNLFLRLFMTVYPTLGLA